MARTRTILATCVFVLLPALFLLFMSLALIASNGAQSRERNAIDSQLRAMQTVQASADHWKACGVHNGRFFCTEWRGIKQNMKLYVR